MFVDIIERGVEAVEAAINPITLVTPTNKADAKRTFLESGSIPRFEYRDLPDVDELRRRIDELDRMVAQLPTVLRRPAASIIATLETKIRVDEARGTPDMPRISAELYGEPAVDTIEHATRILRERSDPPRPDALIDAETVKRELSKALYAYGLTDWEVRLDDREITAVIHSERLIALPRAKRFARDHARRLAAHEVGVHVLRAENGRSQRLSLFAIGLPGFFETEEGLAVFTEVALGVISDFTIRQYALRTLAVRDVLEGLSMEDSCRRFMAEHGLTDAQAFDVSFRAYRGGGLVKDHIYLQGFRKVREHLRAHRVEDLYIGKIGIDDLPLITELRHGGWIDPPALLPDPIPRVNAVVENL